MNEPNMVNRVAEDIKAGMKRGKIVTADEAVRLIRSGDTVALDGLMGGGSPEELIAALEKRYLQSGEPKGLTLLYASGIGDSKDKGVNRLDPVGLLKRVIAGHWGMTPRLQKLAVAEKIEAYNLPQGVIAHMFRDIAAGNPRTISRVGIGTYVDPRMRSHGTPSAAGATQASRILAVVIQAGRIQPGASRQDLALVAAAEEDKEVRTCIPTHGKTKNGH